MACLCVMLTADVFMRVSPVLYVLLCALYFLFLVYGSFIIQGQVFVKAVCRMPGDRNILALTFDDGPDTQHTSELLDVLGRHNVKAVFFCIGRIAEQHPDLIRRIDTEGHVLGLHSYGHSYWYDFKPAATVLQDIDRNAQVIAQITGKQPRWFRPPYGVTNPAIARAVRQGEYQVVGWSVRSYDTILYSTAATIKRILGAVLPGGIILLHDSLEGTPRVVDELITRLKDRSYRFERLDTMIDSPPYR